MDMNKLHIESKDFSSKDSSSKTYKYYVFKSELKGAVLKCITECANGNLPNLDIHPMEFLNEEQMGKCIYSKGSKACIQKVAMSFLNLLSL